MTCLGECGSCLKSAGDAAFGTDYMLADGVFVKHATFPDRDTIAQQHVHKYDHTSFVANGAVRLWIGGNPAGEFRAPSPIFIAKETPHRFQTLEPNTVVLCIHNVARTGGVECLTAK